MSVVEGASLSRTGGAGRQTLMLPAACRAMQLAELQTSNPRWRVLAKGSASCFESCQVKRRGC